MNFETVRNSKKPLRILIWHTHASYLYYLTQTPFEFYFPVKDNGEEGYGRRTGKLPWGENVHDIESNQVKDQEFDCILFQSKKNYLEDQFEILSPKQRDLPRIYLEHDPPGENPADTKHVVDDPNILIVHVSYFNELMWDNNSTPTTVIPNGVQINPQVKYTGELNKGIVAINEISSRGRQLGLDIFEKVRKEIPLDLVGLGSEEVGGLGEIPNLQLPFFMAKYRFFFNPTRYSSPGLSVCEAMMAGTPIIGLATTEMPVIIKNDISGYVHTNIEFLIAKMKILLEAPDKALEMGREAKKAAEKEFNINRFAADWEKTFQYAVEHFGAINLKIGVEK